VGLLDRLRSQPLTEASPSVPLAEHAALANHVEMLEESLAGLEQLAREDVGWRKLGMEQERQFTRDGLLLIHTACLAAFIKSPLIGRGLRIRRNYVWGQGVEITAREVSTEGGEHEVNDLVQALIDSPEYQRVIGSAQAREERETNLGTQGEFFVLAVHDTAARTVRPRLVPAAQIVDYISNPEDLTEVWFYKRQWTTNQVELGTGRREVITRTEWHPVLDYRPPTGTRLDMIGMARIRWDQPIQHCAVNSVTDGPWGIPDAYAAIDWARAYADYLGSWAGLMKSLARYAFKVTAPAKHTGKVTQALRNGRSTDPITGAATDPAGATAVMTPDAAMAPMHSSGATIDASSGKPLAGMTAAALDVPITMLLADPGVTGARATAETLDRPLELTTGSRQNLWVDWLKALLDHVITVAVDDGILAGQILQGPTRQLAVLPDDAAATIDVTFPDIEQTPIAERLAAIKAADDLGTLPPLLIVRLALEALGVDDIDEVLNDMTDDNGQFIDPRVTASVAAVQRERNGAPGSQAAEAYR
jgi:hypothetical protein